MLYVLSYLDHDIYVFLRSTFSLLHYAEYRLVAKKGEGTFSEVLKAQSVITGQYCAVKCMKTHFKSLEQVNNLREIQALRRLNPHPNIIELQEVLYDKQSGRLALVFELMNCNIYEMIKGRRQYVKPARVKLLMYQLLKAVAHMHTNGIFHRDIKPENILVLGDELKVADFGSCRGIYTKQPYTEYIRYVLLYLFLSCFALLMLLNVTYPRMEGRWEGVYSPRFLSIVLYIIFLLNHPLRFSTLPYSTLPYSALPYSALPFYLTSLDVPLTFLLFLRAARGGIVRQSAC